MLHIVKKAGMIPLLLLSACNDSSIIGSSQPNNAIPQSSEQLDASVQPSNEASSSTDASTVDVTTYMFEGDGAMPNGIFNYHHFHSNTHEVLGIRAGQGKVQIGGENGVIVEVAAGDVLVLPAGTGHKRIEASADFSVIGAYPNGLTYDLHTEATDELRDNIKRVARPDTDPVFGVEGPLLDNWTEIPS